MTGARRGASLVLGAFCLSAGGCLQPSPEELALAHQRYAQGIVEQVRSCLAEGSAADAASVAPAIRGVCSCYLGFELREPLLHRLRIVVGADGAVRRVSDAASGDSPQFGSCEAASLVGLGMPVPPGATVLELRLTDVILRQSPSEPVSSAPR